MEPPFVSILIPIRNEAVYIERCLAAVLNQDFPPGRMEILIADGMSDDGTRQKLQAFAEQHTIIQVIDNPKHIVAAGLNLLTQHAGGEILIRVDGHCIIAPDYVSKCVDHLQTGNIDGVGGPMHSIGEDTISSAIALAMSSKFGVGGSAFRTETGQTKLVDTVPFPAYTRAIIDKVGPYDEELVRNQDDEYNYRIRKAGGKILLAADVGSIYYSRGSLRGLWRQYFQYGFYKVRVLQIHPRQMSPRQFIPPAFVLVLLTSILLAFFFSWGWLVLLAITGMYVFANLTAALLTAKRTGWQYLWLLPITFATLHISYGTGFLIGLIRFIHRWQDNN
ncbi:MAG: glycosyltransferase family 2 protein [Brevefilum sp.]|nr:glycosyltransferase family 2 protein [Brevefilum sp.]